VGLFLNRLSSLEQSGILIQLTALFSLLNLERINPDKSYSKRNINIQRSDGGIAYKMHLFELLRKHRQGLGDDF